VAHDFNNLLTATSGIASCYSPTNDPDDRRQADITEIQKAGAERGGAHSASYCINRKQNHRADATRLNVVVADVRGMLGRLSGKT